MKFDKDSMVVLGVLAALSAGYFLTVYRAQSRSYEEVKAGLAQRRQQLERDTQQAARVPPMMREIEAMKLRYNKDWDRRLPESKELAGFLREISGNLAQDRLMSPMIQPGNPTRGPLYNRLPITMKFEGSFLSLAAFLNRVDKMTRLTRIEQLLIEPRREGDSLNVELCMNIYFTEQ